MFTLHDLEFLGHTQNRFRAAKKQKAIRRHDRVDRAKNAPLGWQIEINQHIPTKDDVKTAGQSKVGQQIPFAELNHLADIVVDLPFITRNLRLQSIYEEYELKYLYYKAC